MVRIHVSRNSRAWNTLISNAGPAPIEGQFAAVFEHDHRLRHQHRLRHVAALISGSLGVLDLPLFARLDTENVEVLPLLQEVTSFLEVLAEENDQNLSVNGAVSAQVRADRIILGQVLINLLDNAIKHSPRGGGVSVRVFARDSHSVAIEVEDSGPGIPAEHRDKVFDRFYRVDEGRSRDDGGVGLGLAIAKWGAEIHGGHLELDCPAGRGCVFRLLLPLTTETTAEAQVELARQRT